LAIYQHSPKTTVIDGLCGYEAEDSRTLEAIWGNNSIYNSQVGDGSLGSKSSRDQNECDKGGQTSNDEHINT